MQNSRGKFLTSAYLAGLVALLVVLAACARNDQARNGAKLRRLNLVVVTLDTLRPDHLGCYGYSRIETPNLDGLARKGVLFENAVTQTPLTAPSHASLFTGLYPMSHKVRDTGGFVLPASTTTLAEILQRQGWDTAAFVGASVLKKQFGFDKGFRVYDDRMPAPETSRVAGEYPERRAGEVVDRADAWLSSQSGRPYFLWVHLFDPHSPYDPVSPFKEKYSSNLYDGEIAYTDQQLGRLFDAVRKKSAETETLVVVLSDHGESLSDHGEYTHGIFLYDSTLRIALMMAGAGLPAGVRVKQQARIVDVLPTVLGVMGGSAPRPVDGANLVPAMHGKQAPATYSYAETLYPKINLGWAELRGIRTARWKYVRAPKPELYDLLNDPAEKTNVLDKHPAEAKELEAQLKAVARSGQAGNPEKVETAMLDQRTMEQLKSLGYVGGFTQQKFELTGKGADPKDRLDVIKLLYLGASPDAGIPYARRIALLEQAVAKDPGNPAIYFHLGEEYGKTGRAADAIKLYETALRNGVQNGWAYSRLAYLRLRQGNREEAISLYEKAAQLNPSDYESLSDLAMAYLESGRLGDAERTYKWITTAGSNYASAYNGLGLVAVRKQDLAAARTYFEKAVGADPNLLEAQLNLGRIYKMIGANTRARQCFETFLSKASPAEYGPLINKIKQEAEALR